MDQEKYLGNYDMDLDEKRILDDYKRLMNKRILFFTFMALAIVVFGFVAITIGPIDMSIGDSYSAVFHRIMPAFVESPGDSIEAVVWYVRLPRLLTGLLVGFSLSISGAVMQPVLKNPMASPFTLGVSSGAGFGAALALIMGKGFLSGQFFVVGNAFLFSIITSLAILLISKKRNSSPETMVLVGIALSHLFTACTTVMQYFSDSWATEEVVFWMVGSLSKGTWDNLKYMFPVALVCTIFLIMKSKDLNSIGTGDETAKSLGINVNRARTVFMLVASLLTATTICFTGAIGFIGLVSPHIARRFGSDNRFVVPAAGLIGAMLLMVSDVVAMNVISPVIIPIGVMTSFMGVPLFMYLIIRRRKRSF